MKKHTSFVLLLALSCLQLLQAHPSQGIVELVLDRLYHNVGNYEVKMPQIRVTDSEEFAVAYHPKKNQILIEKKAIDVCRSFGKRSLDAMALMIGHELSHSYQKKGRTSSFLGYGFSNKNKNLMAIEKMADVQAAFGATLADFQTVDIMEPLIDSIYKAYGLVYTQVPGYPSFAERKTKIKEAKILLEELLNTYHHANYLSILGYHELAAASYSYILSYYKGKAIYQKLGLFYAIDAMTFCGKNTDPYLFPFEPDRHTRFVTTRTEALSPLEAKNRDRLLKKAYDYFEETLRFDPRAVQAYLGLLGVRVQQGEYKEVIRLKESGKLNSRLRKMGSTQKEWADVQMVVAIAYALSGESLARHKATAKSILMDLIEVPDGSVQDLAKNNLDILAGKKTSLINREKCTFGIPAITSIDGVSIQKYFDAEPSIRLDLFDQKKLFWETFDHFTLYLSRNINDSCIFQRVFSPELEAAMDINIGVAARRAFKDAPEDSYIIIPAGNRYFVHFPACRLIFLVNQYGRIGEWVRYAERK